MIEDALSDAFFDARERELRDRVGKKRLAHIHGVADTCASLARAYGVDVRRARLAGLLHDWDKGFDDDGIRARAAELGIDVDPFVAEHMPRVLHAETAAAALGREFPEIPPDVLQAIARHTVGAVGMSELDMVVYIADAIEPSRTFGDVESLRAEAGAAPLEDVYFDVYRYWIERMLERRITLHPKTVEIWNDLAVRRASRKARKEGNR